MPDEPLMTTGECADDLNAAYGWPAVTRQRIARDIAAGRLEARVVPAVGTRMRAFVRVPRSAFVSYCEVYHGTVARMFHEKQAASPLGRKA